MSNGKENAAFLTQAKTASRRLRESVPPQTFSKQGAILFGLHRGPCNETSSIIHEPGAKFKEVQDTQSQYMSKETEINNKKTQTRLDETLRRSFAFCVDCWPNLHSNVM